MSLRISVRIRPGPASGGVTEEGCTLGCLPGAEQASEQHELSQVIGVVVGEDERFAQHRRSEEHTSELQSQSNLVCRLLLEKKKIVVLPSTTIQHTTILAVSTIRTYT